MNKRYTTENTERAEGGHKQSERLMSDWPVLLVTQSLSAPLYHSRSLQIIYAKLSVHVNNTHSKKTSKTFMRHGMLREEGLLPKIHRTLSAYVDVQMYYTHTCTHSIDVVEYNVVKIFILGSMFCKFDSAGEDFLKKNAKRQTNKTIFCSDWMAV